MSVLDYNKRFELPFKDVNGNQWRVSIFDRDEENAGGLVERLKGTDSPVSIYYEGDEDFTKGVIGSSCQIRLYGTPLMDGSNDLSLFFTDDEERFYVKVEYLLEGVFELYWSGFLHQDEYIENITSDPYEVELVALDRLATLNRTPNSIKYHLDTEPVLLELVTDFVKELGLGYEGNISINTGIQMENDSGEFLSRQRVPMETYLSSEDSFIEFRGFSDIINDMMISIGCRLFQSNGGIVITRSFASFIELPTIEVPYKGFSPFSAIVVNDDLIARHKPAKRITTMSISTGARNLFFNPSFERSSALGILPVGWNKPSQNIGAFIEVSDEIFEEGSRHSMRTTNNRISDSGFSSKSTAQKNSEYCVAETATRNVRLDNSQFVKDSLQGIMSIKFFIDNIDSSESYGLRFSLSRRAFDGTMMYFNDSNGKWQDSFTHKRVVVESTGEWQELRIEFLMSSFDFFPVLNDYGTNDEPFIFRIHTMNYKDDGSLSNVVVFFDNAELRVYNANGDSLSAFRPETKFYVLSSDEDESGKTDTIDIETFQGITTTETIFADVARDNKFYLMDGKVLGQFTNQGNNSPDKVRITTELTQPYAPLPSELMRVRTSFDSSPKKVYSGTLATKDSSEEDWRPITFNDKVSFNYNNHSSGVLRIVRMNFDMKENRYSCDLIGG